MANPNPEMPADTPAPSDAIESASPLGEQELDVLRFVTEHAPITARAVADEWGQPRGLAKTTIQTVMERLRAKNYLVRVKRYGSFEYSPALSKNALLSQLVHDFVERTLGGSFSPLVQYLADRRGLKPGELAALEQIVAETEAQAASQNANPSDEKEAQ